MGRQFIVTVSESDETGIGVILGFVIAADCPIARMIGLASEAHAAANPDKTRLTHSFFMTSECYFSLGAEVGWFRVVTSHSCCSHVRGRSVWGAVPFYLQAIPATHDVTRDVFPVRLLGSFGEKSLRLRAFHFPTFHIACPPGCCLFVW